MAAKEVKFDEAFLTDQKEREKLRKEALKAQGIEPVVKKVKKVVEDHHDDCGEDLSGLPGFSLVSYDGDSDDVESSMLNHVSEFTVHTTQYHIDITPQAVGLFEEMQCVSVVTDVGCKETAVIEYGIGRICILGQVAHEFIESSPGLCELAAVVDENVGESCSIIDAG